MEIIIKELSELTPVEVIDMIKERIKVFVVEQNCVYQDVDENDYVAKHVFLKEEGEILGYCRIINRETEVTFGRVLVPLKARKRKLGKKLLEVALAEIEQTYPGKKVVISAQHYLLKFYESFGFVAVTDVYLEDDIPHIGMVLKK